MITPDEFLIPPKMLRMIIYAVQFSVDNFEDMSRHHTNAEWNLEKEPFDANDYGVLISGLSILKEILERQDSEIKRRWNLKK
jgi:hypothetical protein